MNDETMLKVVHSLLERHDLRSPNHYPARPGISTHSSSPPCHPRLRRQHLNQPLAAATDRPSPATPAAAPPLARIGGPCLARQNPPHLTVAEPHLAHQGENIKLRQKGMNRELLHPRRCALDPIGIPVREGLAQTERRHVHLQVALLNVTTMQDVDSDASGFCSSS
jgi:hypothetical protein